MSDEEKKDQLRDAGHSFDGIQEYDNQLPKWWVYKFLITIVFAAGYFYFYHFEEGKNLSQTYLDEKMAVDQKLKTVEAASANQISETDLQAMLKKSDVLEKGKAVFATRCASCHGEDGQGIVGPNLTDDYWLHGNKLTEILHTITYGVPEKGMISWKDMISKEEIVNVAVYVKSLHGKKASNPKKPEGILVKE